MNLLDSGRGLGANHAVYGDRGKDLGKHPSCLKTALPLLFIESA